jgi:SPP1 family predicted phage head-tail adaptor
MIGKMNRYPTFYNEASFTQDAGGGVTQVETERWQAWAEIQDRSGNSYSGQATDLTRYDYRVKVRFDSRFSSKTTMIYEGQVCTCNSVVIESEGYKQFMVLLYTRTETWVDLS